MVGQVRCTPGQQDLGLIQVQYTDQHGGRARGARGLLPGAAESIHAQRGHPVRQGRHSGTQLFAPMGW
jgi:hypothetical protein